MQALSLSSVSTAQAANADACDTIADPLQSWIVDALDELDYGLLVVDEVLRLRHANHAARARLGDGRALRVEAGRLRAGQACDEHALAAAIHDAAARGRRALLRLGPASGSISASVVPLPNGGALVALPRPKSCGPLTLYWFARCHGLTPTETQVLQALCEGEMPVAVARRHAVALSTVRTQIGSSRHNTGTSGLRALLHEVAALPPMVGALRALP